jgi:hypothetical protein
MGVSDLSASETLKCCGSAFSALGESKIEDAIYLFNYLWLEAYSFIY